MYKYEGMSRYILNKVETSHHMIWLFHFDDFNYGRRYQRPQQKNILSANQLFSLIDMKRKFINSDNHKFHQYQ
jgi:hypothetical protein